MILVRFVTWSDGRREVDEKCKYPQNRWMVEVEVCGSTPFYSILLHFRTLCKNWYTWYSLPSLDQAEKEVGICCCPPPTHSDLPTFAADSPFETFEVLARVYEAHHEPLCLSVLNEPLPFGGGFFFL